MEKGMFNFLQLRISYLAIFKRSLSEQRFKKWLFSPPSLILILIIILVKRVIFLNIFLMHLYEDHLLLMSLNES